MKERGSWLRAIPRRTVGQERSKWLREENDTEWEARIGRENNGARFSGDFSGANRRELAEKRDCRDIVSVSNFKNNMESKKGAVGIRNGHFNTTEIMYGPGSEEEIGLNLEDRKRRRGGLSSKETMDTEGVY